MKSLSQNPEVQAIVDQYAAALRDHCDETAIIDLNDPRVRLVASCVAASIVYAAQSTDLVQNGSWMWLTAMGWLEISSQP